jgi:molecular chaperone GrpE
LQADFLNLQRNAAREKEQTRDFAITRFASDLLETVDVLSLALKSIPQAIVSSPDPPEPYTPLPPSSPSPTIETPLPTVEASTSPAIKPPEAYLRELHTGVEMTQRLLLQTLFKYHVKPFDPTGDRFDPNRHEALYQAPIPGKEPGSVIDCQKLGYMIKDRVLRAAQVGVAQEIQS